MVQMESLHHGPRLLNRVTAWANLQGSHSLKHPLARKRTRAQRSEDQRGHRLETALPMGDVPSSWNLIVQQFLLKPPFTDAVDVDYLIREGKAFYSAREEFTQWFR